MKLTIKSILAGLLMLIATMAMAQEKYEYAIVFNSYFHIRVITTTVEDINVVKGQVTEVELLAKLKALNAEGWEVYDTGLQAPTKAVPEFFTFFLRRKINQ